MPQESRRSVREWRDQAISEGTHINRTLELVHANWAKTEFLRDCLYFILSEIRASLAEDNLTQGVNTNAQPFRELSLERLLHYVRCDV